ncbi:S41 family peptidase [Alkaliphilus serpentinus]|uniref:S41 family peptidase n=1 Tax=Alkaliphilus serpentinus TaxID=1482731 RepID=A0A833MBK1_9FIRM|nr:S41 family peptidase [Alkaliphilus serpentinus]KAB3533542.1 S41 family peptidase [Alkaliphilus serpentinus]
MISKKKALIGAIILIIITTVLNITVGNLIALQIGNKVIITKGTHEFYKGLKDEYGKLFTLKDYLVENYYQELDEHKLIEGAVRGMFESIDDPYTVYMNEKEYNDLITRTQGTYGGIGIIVTPGEDGYVTVVSPIEDTPGERAGIKTGDKIIKVDGQDIFGEKLDQAVDIMKGEPGTPVTLSILREGAKEFIELNITREEIRLKTVRSEVLENDIGYIRLTAFDEETANDFRQHLTDLDEKNIQGLIVDLRNNPGGLLTTCIEIADMLLGDQVIVYTEDRHGVRKVEKSDKEKVDYPLVLLVNEGSASASEILAGAVKDGEAGTIIGTTTFGKGLVQQFKPLSDGTGFKFTVSQYYTPDGNYIHGTGIDPDIEVKLPEDLEGQEVEGEDDTQLQKAIEVMLEKIGN